MNALLNQPWVEPLGWMLVHSLWQGLAAALLLAIALRSMRSAAAPARYMASCAALLAALLLPVLTVAIAMPRAVPSSVAPVASADSMRVNDTTAPGTTGGASGVPQTKQHLPSLLRAYAVVGWLVGVAILTVWHAGGWWQVQQLRRRGTRAVTPSHIATLSSLKTRLAISRPVRLLESAIVDVPMVIGHLRPAILLPTSALTGLPPLQLEAIIAHELAHVRRHDYLINLLQTMLEIVLFYHPAVWWISNRVRQEREHCCDDIAADACASRVQYARALATMEELRSGWGQPALAASGGILLPRIRRLLGVDAPTGPAKRSIIGIAVVLAMLVATVAFQLSAFAQPPTRRIAALATQPANAPEAKADALPGGPPKVAQSIPADGQLDVDPNLKQVRVVFDRPMNTGESWSFVGGGPGYPKITGKPKWIDDRTIVLPVQLQRGHGYWMSINYGNFNNFRDKTGTPVVPHPISFATRPAKFTKPTVAETVPVAGDKSVDPKTTEIRVTFDQPMNQQNGWTFAHQDLDTFPEISGKPSWINDRTIALPVKLQSSKSYWISVNHPQIQNFHGTNHLAATPYVLEFTTAER